MSFRLPTFPITCNIWRAPAVGGAWLYNAPDVISVCNLAYGERTITQGVGFFSANNLVVCACLLLPKLTDIRYARAGNTMDTVEVPALSQRFYMARYADDYGKGFPNEHRFALIDQYLPGLTLTFNDVGVLASFPYPFP